MKKVISIILIGLLVLIMLVGCEEKVIASREATEIRYTAEYTSVETDYVYKYSWWQEDFVLMPDTHTVTHPEKYEVKYKITYEDNTTEMKWITVDKTTYEKARDTLPP